MRLFDGGLFIFILLIGGAYYFLEDEIKESYNKSYQSEDYVSYEPIKMTENKTDGCGTKITKIYTKQLHPDTKKPLTICLGDLLQEGEHTRIIRVNE